MRSLERVVPSAHLSPFAPVSAQKDGAYSDPSGLSWSYRVASASVFRKIRSVPRMFQVNCPPKIKYPNRNQMFI